MNSAILQVIAPGAMVCVWAVFASEKTFPLFFWLYATCYTLHTTRHLSATATKIPAPVFVSVLASDAAAASAAQHAALQQCHVCFSIHSIPPPRRAAVHRYLL